MICNRMMMAAQLFPRHSGSVSWCLLMMQQETRGSLLLTKRVWIEGLRLEEKNEKKNGPRPLL